MPNTASVSNEANMTRRAECEIRKGLQKEGAGSAATPQLTLSHKLRRRIQYPGGFQRGEKAAGLLHFFHFPAALAAGFQMGFEAVVEPLAAN